MEIDSPSDYKSTLLDILAVKFCKPRSQWRAGSIGNINTLYSLFYQVKKEIREAVRHWSIRSLTDFRRHAQYCPFPPVNPAKFQPPGMPTTYPSFAGSMTGMCRKPKLIYEF